VTGEQGPVWDQKAIMFGAWGRSYGGKEYFDVSAGGTNQVDSITGINTWSSSVTLGITI
jgi:hypothetical protein